jgi:hypothetical protein
MYTKDSTTYEEYMYTKEDAVDWTSYYDYFLLATLKIWLHLVSVSLLNGQPGRDRKILEIPDGNK